MFIYFVFYCFIHSAEALKNSFTERLARGHVAYTEQTLALVWVSTLRPGNSLRGSFTSGLAHPNNIIITVFFLFLFFVVVVFTCMPSRSVLVLNEMKYFGDYFVKFAILGFFYKISS